MDKLQQAMKNTRGFSLIEVVVALVIFTISDYNFSINHIYIGINILT